MTPHEEDTIKERIMTIAAVVRDLTCMIGVPPDFDAEAVKWWSHKLNIYHNRMADIANDC